MCKHRDKEETTGGSKHQRPDIASEPKYLVSPCRMGSPVVAFASGWFFHE